jgi:hypothetical protein
MSDWLYPHTLRPTEIIITITIIIIIIIITPDNEVIS